MKRKKTEETPPALEAEEAPLEQPAETSTDAAPASEDPPAAPIVTDPPAELPPAAEYPGADWVPADESNYRAGRAAGPGTLFGLVVIHITDGHGEAGPVAEMWQQPRHKSSAHFVVGQDGRVIQAVRLEDTAWHAHSANGRSVGVEHCARTPGELSHTDQGLRPSDAQLEASARLVAWLLRLAGLEPGPGTVKGHRAADPATTHEDCPDGVWDWPRYMAMVQAAYDAPPA